MGRVCVAPVAWFRRLFTKVTSPFTALMNSCMAQLTPSVTTVAAQSKKLSQQSAKAGEAAPSDKTAASAATINFFRCMEALGFEVESVRAESRRTIEASRRVCVTPPSPRCHPGRQSTVRSRLSQRRAALTALWSGSTRPDLSGERQVEPPKFMHAITISDSPLEDCMIKTSHAFAVVSLAAAFAAIAAHTGNAQDFHVVRYSIGGDGGTDYLTAEPGTGRVFVSRGTHVMVIDGATGKVIGDIPDTPRTHGIALAPSSHYGFITNGGDSTVTMFDLKTLAVLSKIKVPSGGLDGIMYDAADDRVILTNHSRPIGTMTAIDPRNGKIVGQVDLEDDGPEGAASDGRGRIT